MKLSKKIFLPMLLGLTALPLTIVASCNSETTNNENQQPPTDQNPDQPTNPPISAVDQQAVNQEVKRLEDSSVLTLNKTVFSLTELEQIKSNNQLLKNYLQGLEQNGFNYEIIDLTYVESNSFNTFANNNTVEVPYFFLFSIKVSKNGAQGSTKTLKMAFKLQLSNDQNQNIIQKKLVQEQQRMSQAKLWFKYQDLKAEDLEKFKANPDLILKAVIGWVPMQGFKYRVENFNADAVLSATNQKQMSFDLKAIYKTSETQVQKFTLNYRLVDDVVETPPVVPPVTANYKIALKNPDQENYTYDINQQLNAFLVTSENINELLAAILKTEANNIFTITGDLPQDWDWAEEITTASFSRTENGTKIDIDCIIFNADPNNEDEAILQFSFTLSNFKWDPNEVPPAKPEEDLKPQFEELKAKLEAQTANLVFDDFRIHGVNEEQVFQFANIRANKTSKGFASFFKNLDLNALRVEFKHKFDIQPIDIKINYLKNEIKWKWSVSAFKNDQLNWTSKEHSVIYRPDNNFINPLDQKVPSNEVSVASEGAVSLRGLLDQFQINPEFVPLSTQEEWIKNLGQNWTWKARELVTHLRFAFFQSFNENATEIDYGIKGVDFDTAETNPQNYTVILKAKIKQNTTFKPFFQLIGATGSQNMINLNAGDIVTMELNVNSVLAVPIVFTSANEILPGMDPGFTLGRGEGYEAIVDNRALRTDLFSAELGTYEHMVKVNGQKVPTGYYGKVVHRNINFGLLNRYDINS